MQLDIKKAIKSPFSDDKWYLKMIFPFIMVILSAVGEKHLHIPDLYVGIIVLVTIIPNLILTGLFLQFQHNELHNEKPLLPILKNNITKYLKYGFKSLGFILYYFLLFILFAILIYIVVQMAIPKGKEILEIILICILYFLFYLVYMVAQSAYADKFSLADAFNFNGILNLILKVKMEIFIYLLTSILIIMVAAIIFYIFMIHFVIVSVILIPMLITLAEFMLVDLQAQVYKIGKYRLEPQG